MLTDVDLTCVILMLIFSILFIVCHTLLGLNCHLACVCLQLDELFSVVLSSHSTPASHLGNNREINITVRQNEDPFGVIEFVQPGLSFTISESTSTHPYFGQ